MTQQIKEHDLTRIHYQHYDMFYKMLVTFYDNTVCVIKEIQFQNEKEKDTAGFTHLQVQMKSHWNTIISCFCVAEKHRTKEEMSEDSGIIPHPCIYSP